MRIVQKCQLFVSNCLLHMPHLLLLLPKFQAFAMLPQYPTQYLTWGMCSQSWNSRKHSKRLPFCLTNKGYTAVQNEQLGRRCFKHLYALLQRSPCNMAMATIRCVGMLLNNASSTNEPCSFLPRPCKCTIQSRAYHPLVYDMDSLTGSDPLTAHQQNQQLKLAKACFTSGN